MSILGAGGGALNPYSYRNGSGQGVYGDYDSYENPYAPAVGLGFGGTNAQRYGSQIVAATVASDALTLAAAAGGIYLAVKSPAIYRRVRSAVPFRNTTPTATAAPTLSPVFVPVPVAVAHDRPPAGAYPYPPPPAWAPAPQAPPVAAEVPAHVPSGVR